MKNSILIALFLNVLNLSAQEIQWVTVEEALALNEKKPKPILFDVYTDWCGWCKRMDANTYSNKVIIDYINKKYYAVKLDGEGKKDIIFKNYTFTFKSSGRRGYHEFAAALLNGKLSYPTTVIMNEKQELLDRIPGYLDPKIMEKVLYFFGEEKYKTVSWADFQKGFKSNITP